MKNQTNVNYGFLYLNGLHLGNYQKSIVDINTNKIIGYVNDDLNYYPDLLNSILIKSQEAFLTKISNPNERINNLNQLCKLLKQHLEPLSLIMSQEIGKRLIDCQEEILRSIIYIQDTIDFYQQHYLKYWTINNEKLTHNINKIGKFKRVPLGVVLGIVPFNFPINLLITKLAPAYLSGNAVIIKPSSKALLTTSYFASLVNQIGINDNTIQIINFFGSKKLYQNPYINMISFTGSTKVGSLIAQQTSQIPLVLEMGGKDVCLVLDDANLNQVVDGIIRGAFSYNGQRCTAIKKVLVSKTNHDKLVDLLLIKIQELSVGNSIDNHNITPMIDQNAINYINELVEDAINFGGIIKPNYCVQDKFIYPCLVDNVNSQMRISFEEQFGPILPIQTYNNLDEAIKIINQSEYGLQASIYTTNEELFYKLANLIDCGTINWNGPSARGPDVFPFLGVKKSGFGVQGIQFALESMTRIKGFVINKYK